MNTPLSDNEKQLLVALLQRLPEGFVPYEIFEQFARILALPIVEVVPVRSVNNSVQVLLLSRGPDDPIWPNQLHTPGTVVRATDERQPAAIHSRITQEELAGTQLGELHLASNILHRSKRGVEQAQIYWAEVTGEPKAGEFFDAKDLPQGLMDSQREFIARAVQNYTDNKLNKEDITNA
mgnify:CR=1 FL=1